MTDIVTFSLSLFFLTAAVMVYVVKRLTLHVAKRRQEDKICVAERCREPTMPVTIARFSFPHEAHVARTLLDASGIPAFVADGHTISTIWLLSNAMGGVRLLVPAAFAAQAQEILNEPAEIEPIPEMDEPDDPCPHCGGALGGRYVAGKRLAFVTWVLQGFPFYPIKKVRDCTVCSKTSDIAQRPVRKRFWRIIFQALCLLLAVFIAFVKLHSVSRSQWY